MYHNTQARYKAPKLTKRKDINAVRFAELGYQEFGCAGCDGKLHFYKEVGGVEFNVWFGKKYNPTTAIFSVNEGEGWDDLASGYQDWEDLFTHLEEND